MQMIKVDTTGDIFRR